MEEYIQYYKDGSVWAKGYKLNGHDEGYWEWFRHDGTIERSGHFQEGREVGEWISYDAKGQPLKVVQISDEEGDLPRTIGRPAMAALKVSGIIWLKDIAKLSDKELLALHGMGPKAVQILRQAIEERGMV